MSLGTESFGLFSCMINGEERDQTHRSVYRWNRLALHYQKLHTRVTVQCICIFRWSCYQSPEWTHGQWILDHSQKMAPFVTHHFQEFFQNI